MTMPRHPPLSIKRNAVPLRGLVTPVYLYWYPVFVLKGPLICCLWAVSELGGISSHFRTEFGFLQFVCVFLPLSSERTEFHGFTVFLVLGTSFFWVVVVPLRHWMLLYCLSACLEHNDWHHWIPLMVLVGALLALAMATG